MIEERSDELFKESRREKKQSDIWDELYRLNTFTTNLGLSGAASDGYPIRKLLANLARAEVKFIIVGGVAVALNGFIRTTDEGQARELSVANFATTEGAIRVIEEFPLDIFTLMRGKSFNDFAESRRQIEIDGKRIDFLNADARIQLKLGSTREKDRIDISALRNRSGNRS